MTQAANANPIQRQVRLPIAKAVEIAWKSIRLRLSRSLVVTSSITLAIAFLVSILCGEAIVDSMRDWMHGFESSPRAAELAGRRQQLETQAEAEEAQVRAALREAPMAAGKDLPPVDFKRLLGKDLAEVRDELGGLPAPAAELTSRLPASEPGRTALVQWAATARELKRVRDELAGPQTLALRMKLAGVAVAEGEVAQARAQTRWVVSLALLVAFVGILNAMLMSVTERFREIGTMKCLGALDGFIVKLFLIESLFQGGVGTAFGLALGVAASLVVASWSFGTFAWVQMPWASILGVCGMCLLIGLVLTVAGALYPAWQAARMQPIAAMRTDV